MTGLPQDPLTFEPSVTLLANRDDIGRRTWLSANIVDVPDFATAFHDDVASPLIRRDWERSPVRSPFPGRCPGLSGHAPAGLLYATLFSRSGRPAVASRVRC